MGRREILARGDIPLLSLLLSGLIYMGELVRVLNRSLLAYFAWLKRSSMSSTADAISLSLESKTSWARGEKGAWQYWNGRGGLAEEEA